MNDDGRWGTAMDGMTVHGESPTKQNGKERDERTTKSVSVTVTEPWNDFSWQALSGYTVFKLF